MEFLLLGKGPGLEPFLELAHFPSFPSLPMLSNSDIDVRKKQPEGG